VGSVEELTDSECRDLLSQSTFGRLGVLVDGYPFIFPINYGLDGEAIIFRTGVGTKLAAVREHKVSFEVDQIEQGRRAAWSVLVLGTASVVAAEDSDLIRRLERLAVTSFAPGEKPVWVRIVAERTSGRRIVTDDVGFALDPRGYLGLYQG
jgi:nitroimidazol reductase NimA-like FMN-containing flavoprotein (pyridoxamine 5'-phosphate oxidase superfamily)